MKKKSQILSISLIVACLAVVILLQNREKPPEENLQARSEVKKTSRASRSSHSNNDRVMERERVHVSEGSHQHGAGCGCSAHSSEAVSVEAVEPASLLVDEVFMDKMLGIAEGAAVDFPLPSGKQARGTVSNIFTKNGQVVSTQGLLQAPQKGYFFFRKELQPSKNGEYFGVVAFDEGKVAYHMESQSDGSSRLVKTHVNDVLCDNYDVARNGEIASAQRNEIAQGLDDHPDEGTSPNYQNAVPRLESLPGATAVIYLDFDGQEGPIEGWPQVTSGALPSELTTEKMKKAWQYVAENFAPFNINVTTDLAVYLAAPENSRQRCIHSRSSPKKAGVALVGSFQRGGDIPCWVEYTDVAGYVVMCHELGHTFGLHHDGRDFADGRHEEYYGGHGPTEIRWGAIMGSGGGTVSQWSKGEYPLASNTAEDDLAIIAANPNSSYRPDDHGGSFATASYLEILASGAVTQQGVIETRTDFDSFRFTTTAAGIVNFTVTGATQDSNLDILAEIVGSDGVIITSANPDLAIGPVSLNQNLPAGDYFLRVSGVGRGDLATGYTDYGSLGYYKVTGTVPNAFPAAQFSVVENSANGVSVGSVIPNKAHGSNALTFSIASGNTPAALQINTNSGEITVADGSLINFEAAGAYYDKPSRFELFVSVTDTVDTSLNEIVRVVVTVGNVNEAPSVKDASGINLLEHTPKGSLMHKMEVSDPDYQDTFTYAITQGNSDGYFAINDVGEITVATDISATLSSEVHNLTVKVTDAGTPALTGTATVSITLIKLDDDKKSQGSISQTNYSNIEGKEISFLENAAKFPHSPDTIHVLKEFRAVSGGSNFGGAVRGFIIPPTSGDYTFWVSGNKRVKLWLSTDDTPDNLELIARCDLFTAVDQWTKFATQKSAVKSLIAGKAYYVQLLYKNSINNNHASVAWEGPGITREVIPGRFMAPHFIDYAPIINTPSPALSVRKDAYNGYTAGKIEAIDFNAGDTLSQYKIIGGNPNGEFAIDPDTGKITVANSSKLNAGSPVSLEVSVTDSGSPARSGTKTISINVDAPPPAYAGRIYKDVWKNIPGNEITTLTSNANYPNSPTEVREYNTLDQGSPRIGINYGARIRAYVIPSVSGNYTFWISSNDRGQLFMSPDENPANAEMIASNSHWTISGRGDNEWIYLLSQKSAEKALIAGKKYYIEILHKKVSTGDELRVAWTKPGMAAYTQEIIASPNLEAYDPNAQPIWSAPSYTFTIEQDSANGSSVGTVLATDADSTNLLYNILSGNDAGAFAIDFKTGKITVKDQSALVVGTYSLQIGVQDDYLSKYYFFGQSSITATIKVAVSSDSDNDLLTDTWEIAHFGNTSTYTATSDPDGDGLDNFAEMAFATNPLVKDSTSSRTKAVALKEGDSEFMEYRYRRPKNHASLSLVYETKISLNLKDWLNVADYNFVEKSVESTPADSFEWVVYKIPNALYSKVFAKTEVKPAP